MSRGHRREGQQRRLEALARLSRATRRQEERRRVEGVARRATQVAGLIHVVGVRHHSPACARLVEATIRAVKPKHVLIEGPADMNARLDELLLPHSLPIAIFTYYRDDQNRTH